MQRSLVTLAGLALTVLTIAVLHMYSRIGTLEAQLVKAGSKGGQVRAPLTAPQPVIPRANLTDLEKTTISLFSERSQSVAHITTLQQVRTNPFQMDATAVPRGSGSGFVWDTQGHIVTNFHVIQGADAARVTLSDQSEWMAKLVGGSERNDIAVLRIDRPEAELRPIVLGTSHDLSVGQQVFAIGSPFGLDYTLSTGVISGLGREITGLLGVPIQGVIQTDAAINPGNSGGPLLDSSGRLIGMNTMIVSPSGASSGVGFAVPADIIRRVVPDLIKYGREVRPSIGVQLADDAITRRFGLSGAIVALVFPGTPAEKVGLLPARRDQLGRIALGDVIVGVDDTPIEKNADLYLALEKYKGGDKVKLTLLRGGDTKLELVTELILNVDQPK
jgi:S1-C subfamily serine protease